MTEYVVHVKDKKETPKALLWRLKMLLKLKTK